jgi:DOPA 4,5-dioxygenase
MDLSRTDSEPRRTFIKLAPQISISGYHAHLYYDETSIEVARHVRLLAKETFPDLELGNLHTNAVGPHPTWSTQLAFEPFLLPMILPWLMINRRQLTVFIHPLTGNDYRDHTDLAMWMGRQVSLNLAAFH